MKRFVDPLTGKDLEPRRVRTYHPGREARPRKADLGRPPSLKTSIDRTLKWVGTDPERAKLVLVREQAGQDRVSLIEALLEIITHDDDSIDPPTDDPATPTDGEPDDQTAADTPAEPTDPAPAEDGNAEDANTDAPDATEYADGDQGVTDGVEATTTTDDHAQEA